MAYYLIGINLGINGDYFLCISFRILRFCVFIAMYKSNFYILLRDMPKFLTHSVTSVFFPWGLLDWDQVESRRSRDQPIQHKFSWFFSLRHILRGLETYNLLLKDLSTVSSIQINKNYVPDHGGSQFVSADWTHATPLTFRQFNAFTNEGLLS
jgi:hypothetical protein